MYYNTAAHNGLTILPSITDSTLNINQNGYTAISGMNYIAGAYAMSAHAARAKVSAPSLVLRGDRYIEPVDAGAQPTTQPPYDDAFAVPEVVTPNDEVDFYIDNVNNNEASYGIVFFSSGPIQPISGAVLHAEATATTTVTANAWTQCTLTFTTPLAFATYDIVGLNSHFAGGVAARIRLPGYPWAPGTIASSTANRMMPKIFRNGRLGVWATFQTTVPPTVEVFGNVATASERFVLDLIKH